MATNKIKQKKIQITLLKQTMKNIKISQVKEKIFGKDILEQNQKKLNLKY